MWDLVASDLSHSIPPSTPVLPDLARKEARMLPRLPDQVQFTAGAGLLTNGLLTIQDGTYPRTLLSHGCESSRGTGLASGDSWPF